MSISFTARVSIPDEILVRRIEDESIILNLNNENYYGLDATGTRMWSVLTSSGSIQETFETLRTQYDVNDATLKSDMVDFVGQLAEQGIIELID